MTVRVPYDIMCRYVLHVLSGETRIVKEGGKVTFGKPLSSFFFKF